MLDLDVRHRCFAIASPGTRIPGTQYLSLDKASGFGAEDKHWVTITCHHNSPILTAHFSVRALAGEAVDPWAVNVEQEYHEER